MAVQWCTFVQFTKIMSNPKTFTSGWISYIGLFFLKNSPPIMGSCSRIGIHPDQNSPFNCCLGEWVFFSFRNSFFRGPKNASGARKNEKTLDFWPFKAKNDRSIVSCQVSPRFLDSSCLVWVAKWHLWLDAAGGRSSQVKKSDHLLLVAQKMSYNNPQGLYYNDL